MIQSIRFENFKVFEELDVKLAPLTGIVGPNASGKTSILEGIYLNTLWVRSQTRYNDSLPDQDSEQVRFAADEIQRRTRHGASWTSLSFESTSGNARYKVINDKQDYQVNVDRSFRVGPVLLRLSGAKIAIPSISDELTPSTRLDGDGLPSALAYLALNQPEKFSDLQAHLRSILPSIRRIRFSRAPIRHLETQNAYLPTGEVESRKVYRMTAGETLVFDVLGADNIPAELMSEGTLLVVAILYFLVTVRRPALILLDDLDHGLHPKAQHELVKLIQSFVDVEQDIQFIFTTHSPYLLDSLNPEQILLTTLRDDGTAVCGSLTEHPDFEQWKDEMRPGEMWSFFGEDWVAELERNKVK